MNNLIKQLAEQAFNEYESVYKSDANIPTEFTEKFAELIVKECARISNEVDYTMTNQGAASAQAFMEHFGVEE